MSFNTMQKAKNLFSLPKFEARWELIRFGLIGVSLVFVSLLIYTTIFICVDWFFTLWFGNIHRNSVVITSTLLALLSFHPLRYGVRSTVDHLIYPDTASLKDQVTAACRTVAVIDDRSALTQFLETKLPELLRVDGVYLHQHPQPQLLRQAVMLPLQMGSRPLGYLTIGPKLSGRSFSHEERAMLGLLQEQVSLVLSGIQLAETREKAEQVAKLKSDFLTNVSHQLRTPLNAVINSTGLVADGMLGAVNSNQTNFLNRALQGAEHLKKLLNDVLDMTKIEIGQLSLQLETIELKMVVDDILPMINGMIKDKPVDLRVEFADDLPFLIADRLRVRQILLNLLSNAAKFTREGTITLKIWPEREWLYVSVADTGIGIAEENLALIFEDFTQLSVGSQKELRIERRRHLGTGLGIPITKALVELHKGRIWVDSTLGEGTVFTFTLPIRQNAGVPQIQDAGGASLFPRVPPAEESKFWDRSVE